MHVNGEPMDLAYVVGVLLANRDLERRLAAENAGDTARSVAVACSSARRPSTAAGKVSSCGSTARPPAAATATAPSQPTVAAPSAGCIS